MPTKPTAFYELATDPTFSFGPAIGLSTKIILPSLLQGNVPGTGAAAEHVNYTGNINGQWITNWLLVGTSAADEDAHLVETNATGTIQGARVSVGGATVGGPTPAVSISAPTTGGGEALNIINSTTDDHSLLVNHSVAGSTGIAVRVLDTDGSGTAVSIQSGGPHTGKALAVIGQSGTALEVTTGSGTAADITAGTGPGVIVTSTDGNPAPLRLTGRDVPSTPVLGDIYVDDLANFERLRIHHSGSFRTAWTTTLGFARDYGESLGASSSAAAGSFITKVSVVIPASAGLSSTATVHVRAVAEIGTSIAGSIIQLELLDATAPTSIEQRTIRTFQAAGAADEKYVVFERDYTIPSTGARTFELGFQSDGVNTSYIRNASLEITGQYD